MPAPLIIYGVLLTAEQIAALLAGAGLAAYTATPQARRQVSEAINATGRAIDLVAAGRPAQAVQSCPFAKPLPGAKDAAKAKEQEKSSSDDPCKSLQQRYDLERPALNQMEDEHARLSNELERIKSLYQPGIDGLGGDRANTLDRADVERRLSDLLKRMNAERARIRPLAEALFKCRQDQKRKAAEDEAKREAEEARKKAADAAARQAQDKLAKAREKLREYTEDMPLSRQDPNGPGRLFPHPKTGEYVTTEQILKHFLSLP